LIGSERIIDVFGNTRRRARACKQLHGHLHTLFAGYRFPVPALCFSQCDCKPATPLSHSSHADLKTISKELQTVKPNGE
jgi:hypothetical protein